jgi:3',5'-cyclic-AMP phosphodiesterase
MTAACWLSTLSTLGMSIAVSGCLAATPFDTEPSEEDLTARNLARIRELPPPSDAFKFVALGDTHDNYAALARGVAAINARDDVQFVIVAGDLTDLALLGEFEFTREEFARLEVPYLTVIGNHDALGDGIEIYQRMFGALDYTLHFGSVKFVFFNSNTLEFDGKAPNRAWLEDELSDLEGAASAIWVTHQEVDRPDDGEGGDGDAFYARLLDEHPGTSLVIHGHRIPHELWRYRDTPVLQCGTFQSVFTYNVVTVRDGRASQIEVCDLDGCDLPVSVL